VSARSSDEQRNKQTNTLLLFKSCLLGLLVKNVGTAAFSQFFFIPNLFIYLFLFIRDLFVYLFIVSKCSSHKADNYLVQKIEIFELVLSLHTPSRP